MSFFQPLKTITACFIILCAMLPAWGGSAGKQVLIIHSYHSGLSWTDSLMNGIRDAFDRSGREIELSAEYLDARRVVDAESKRRIENFLVSKLQSAAPDLVIVSDNAGLDLILKYRGRLFVGVPIVFCGINDFRAAMISSHRGITGVAEETSLAETVNLSLRLHPKTKQIIVIGRTTVAADKHNRDALVSALSGLPSGIQVIFWDDLSTSELRARLKKTSEGSILFLNGLITDETGRQLMYGETTKWISGHSSVPVYSSWDVYLGYGIVGGKLISAYRQGELAAELALRIFNGESADRIPIVSGREANRYIFDYRQLARFDIPLSSLPHDSLIINRPDTFYHKYKHIVWSITLAVLGLSGLVIFLSVSIMRRRKVEEELRIKTDELDRIFTLSPDLLCIAGMDGRFIRLNPAWEQALGYRLHELEGRMFMDFVHPDDVAATRQAMAELAEGKDIIDFTNRYQCGDGTYRWIEWRSTPFQKILIYAAARDVTERKFAEREEARLKEQLFQSQKMETVGLLAGGVAHDFNNLLTPILGYSEILMLDLPDEDPCRQKLEQINQAASLARDLIKRLLVFSRKQMLDMDVVNVGDIIRGFEKVVHRTIRENILIKIDISPMLGQVRADKGHIEQVLLNLAVNSQDAMPDGGVLTIEARDIDLDESYTSSHPEIMPGAYVMLAVSDTGTGMDELIREHIFEPFFTTKELGKGTGLGLATVYGIVKQHGGSISVYSEKNQGSTFKIFLPKVTDKANKIDKEDTLPERIERGKETILVMEDNETVRMLASRMLEGLGYRVLVAEDVKRCVEIAAEHSGIINLLLTDVIMPKMNGKELYELLKRDRPEMGVLFMSGYTRNVIGHHGMLDEGINFLQKPFTLAALSQKVRRALES